MVRATLTPEQIAAETAAKAAGVNAVITTAKSGHKKNVKGSNRVSRHMSGTGVDVAIVGNKSFGEPGFKQAGDKLKNAFPKKFKELEVVALAVLKDGKIDGYDGLDKQISSSEIEKFTDILGIS